MKRPLAEHLAEYKAQGFTIFRNFLRYPPLRFSSHQRHAQRPARILIGRLLAAV